MHFVALSLDAETRQKTLMDCIRCLTHRDKQRL